MKKHSLSRAAAAAAALVTLAMAAPRALASSKAPDIDGDGIPNIVDPDVDNDGIPNALDKNVDGGVARTGPFAGKYVGDHLDNDNPAEEDIDGDGQKDDSLAESDVDGDGKRDDASLEDDIDGDRRKDDSPAERDIDGDGNNDDASLEDDIDGDGLSDDESTESDIDGDSMSDDDDSDIDGDDRSNADSTEDDTDGDGMTDDHSSENNDDGDSLDDRMDPDDDNDGNSDEDDSDHHQEDDEQEVEISLTRQALAPADSRIRVKIQQMATGKIELEIEGRSLAAGTYDVMIDGVRRGGLVMALDGDRTEGELEWETNPNDKDELPLDFEAIGKSISIELASEVYFSGTVPTPPPPSGTPPVSVEASATLQRGAAAPPEAHGKLEIEFGTAGAKELQIEMEGLAPGSYDVFFGEIQRAVLTVSGGESHLKFDTSPETASGELLLDFDPAGLPVTVKQGSDIIFTGTVPAAPPGIGDGDGSTPLVASLAGSAAVPAGARAKVQIQFGSAGTTELEVEAEGLPAGPYQVMVNEVQRGVLTIANGAGRLEFETTPDAPEDLLLDFPTAGLPITISQGDVILFTGTIPVRPA